MPEKIHTELASEGGLLSAALFSLLGDAWRKRGKWREEWRCRQSGDGFANVYRGLRRERPRSLIRVQMLYCGKVWIDVPDTPGGEVKFIEENVKEHALPPAGAHSETGVEVQTTPDSADKAAGGGCVARLVRCSSSSPVEWVAPDECGKDTGSGILRIPDAPSVGSPADSDENLTGDLRQ